MLEFFPEDRAYTTKPTFKKLSTSLRNLTPDPAYITAKQQELEAINTLWFHDKSADAALQATAKKLDVNKDTILDIGLSIEEDVVIMHQGRIASAFVAFPSGWDPANRRMMTLTELHDPVADGEDLRRASERISQMMCSGLGPWCRYVWTVTSSSKLSNHPSYTTIEPKSIDDLYFRYEYQTFDTVTKNETSVFLIKTVVAPYREYVSTAERHNLIVKYIDSMSESVLKYKNLKKIQEILHDDRIAYE